MSKGVVLSVLASVLFAVMYYFTSLLTPLSGLEIFGWRMLLTVPCMTVFMLISGEWRRVWDVLRMLAARPRLIGGIVVIEKVFNWPGMGTLAFDDIGGRDYLNSHIHT